MTSIPNEFFLDVLKFLGANELRKLKPTCRQMKILATEIESSLVRKTIKNVTIGFNEFEDESIFRNCFISNMKVKLRRPKEVIEYIRKLVRFASERLPVRFLHAICDDIEDFKISKNILFDELLNVLEMKLEYCKNPNKSIHTAIFNSALIRLPNLRAVHFSTSIHLSINPYFSSLKQLLDFIFDPNGYTNREELELKNIETDPFELIKCLFKGFQKAEHPERIFKFIKISINTPALTIPRLKLGQRSEFEKIDGVFFLENQKEHLIGDQFQRFPDLGDVFEIVRYDSWTMEAWHEVESAKFNKWILTIMQIQ